MTTADYALIVSLSAVVISIAALLWNVWQKFIFVKPALHVSFGLYKVLLPNSQGQAVSQGQKLVSLTVTNMGPGPVIVYACIGRERFRLGEKRQLGVLNPIHGDPTSLEPTSIGPFSSGLPTKVESGDMKTLYFPYAKGIFLKDDLARVGVTDTYGRNTWCSRRDMWKVSSAYRADFA